MSNFSKYNSYFSSLFLAIFFYHFYNVTGSAVSYVTVYGRVLSGNYSINTTTVSYNDCMKLCMARQQCVLAYGNTNCQLYDYGNLGTVYQENGTTSGPEDIVTFRVNRDSCPAKPATNPPTFDNYPATGKIESGESSLFYRIHYYDGVWEYETLEQNKTIICDDAWHYTERKFGVSCVGFVSTNYSLDCSAYNVDRHPNNSAIESLDEVDYSKPYIILYDVVYLNARMTPECWNSSGTDCDNIMLGEFLTPPFRIPWLPGYPTEFGECVAMSHIDEAIFGLINLDCEEDYQNRALYCGYTPDVVDDLLDY